MQTIEYAYSDGDAFVCHYYKIGKIVIAYSGEVAKISMTAGNPYTVNNNMSYKPNRLYKFDMLIRNNVNAYIALDPTSTPNFSIIPRSNITAGQTMGMMFVYFTN